MANVLEKNWRTGDEEGRDCKDEDDEDDIMPWRWDAALSLCFGTRWGVDDKDDDDEEEEEAECCFEVIMDVITHESFESKPAVAVVICLMMQMMKFLVIIINFINYLIINLLSLCINK